MQARASMKNATQVSRPVWLGVGIEEPTGFVETQVHLWGTVEKISRYILAHAYAHMSVYTDPSLPVVCSLSLRARVSPMKLINYMKKAPSQICLHAIAITGTHSQPGHT